MRLLLFTAAVVCLACAAPPCLAQERPSGPIPTVSMGISQYAVSRYSSLSGFAVGPGFTLAVRSSEGWGVEFLGMEVTSSLDRNDVAVHLSVPVSFVWAFGDGVWNGLYARWGFLELGGGNQGAFVGTNASIGWDLPLGDHFVLRILELRGFAGGRFYGDDKRFDGGVTASTGITVR